MKPSLRPRVRFGLLIALVVCCAAALAQQPDQDDDRGVAGDAASTPAQSTTNAAADTAKESEVDTAETVRDAAEVEAPGGTAEDAAKETAGQAVAAPDGEFTPAEEITEDYPVPLPSDI